MISTSVYARVWIWHSNEPKAHQSAAKQPSTQRYAKKKIENHSLIFSINTLHGGDQLANMISNIVKKVRENLGTSQKSKAEA